MKKRIFLFALILVNLSTKAQLERGRSLIGGSFGLTQNNFNANDTTYGRLPDKGNEVSYNINVNYGYFVKDNLAVGVLSSFSHSNNKSFHGGSFGGYTSYKYYYENYGLSLFARCYKYVYKNKLAFFVSFSAGYSEGNGSQTTQSVYHGMVIEDNSSSNKTIGGNIRVQPGLVYFINRVIAVEANFGGVTYSIQRVKTFRNGILVSTSDYGNFNSNLNLSLTSLSLGFNFYFGHPKPATQTKQQ